MPQTRKLTRKIGVSLLAGATALLLAFYTNQRAREAPTFASYPAGTTAVTYVGSYRQKFDGQEFATFKFGNGEGTQLKVTAKILDWDAQELRWKEEARTISETVPNRSQWEFHIGRQGRWKVIVQAYAQPSLADKLAARFTKGARTQGGLIGGSSPEMIDAKPAKEVRTRSTTMTRRFDHIDLRVPEIALVASFYSTLLPALGFTRRVPVEGWLQFESGDGGVTEFFGVTESSQHVPNENRIAFWADNVAAVQRLAEIAKAAGAQKIEGPMDYEPGYYAVFFEDPCGNRLEVCHRVSV